MKAAKLPEIRWHDMRHTFALLSLQQGVDIKTLQSDLGHNSIETTLDRYGHVNEEMKRDAANKRSGLLKDIVNGNKVQKS
jgi:integrase